MKKPSSTRILLAALGLQAAASAMLIQDPATDFAFLEFEPYSSFGGERFGGPMVESSDKRAWRLAGQLSFPAGTIGSNQLFGSFKSTLMERDVVLGNQALNEGVLQRYWLSGGSTWPGRNGQSSLALVGVGINSDFADISLYDFNTEWIYSHFWTVNASFNWGLGLDVQQYFDTYAPYPLIFVEWKLSDRTKLKWDADFLEMRRFLNPWLCFTAGVRFNLEFFALKNDADFKYDSMGLETGLQYAVGGNFYARLKYKELIWGEEILGLPDGSHHTRAMSAGRSLRLNIAYGM